MLPANVSRRLLLQASRGFVAKNVPLLAFFSTKSAKKHNLLEEQQDCFDIDDYDHRSVLENRSHVKMNKLGEVDEYDRIMLRTQPPSPMAQVGDVDDWDHRIIVQQPQSSSCTTTHQPRSITMAAQSIRDDGDELVGGIPAFESYLAENFTPNNDTNASAGNTSAVVPDMDDWDHRAVLDPLPNLVAEERSQSMEGDIDDYDHRALYQASVSPPSPQKEESRHLAPELIIEGGDIDDYDHRIQEAAGFAENAPTVEDEQGDIDDYDHRSLQNPPPADVESKDKKTKLWGLSDKDDDDSLILDSRSKWALGNLTKKDIEEEREASAQHEAEKKARKEKEAELRRHAWGG